MTFINKLKSFDIIKAVSNWWKNESKSSKSAFVWGMIIGFVSHVFVYMGRYYGRDDMGTITKSRPQVGTGRWFNTFTNSFTYEYIVPIISGILVTLFLAAAAFYVCKLFKIEKKSNAIIIAGLLTTFPSIANTNLFLYDTANYHLAVLLGVLAVYLTVKYKFGFIAGGVLSMLTLATYQTKFSIVLTLSLFFMLNYLLNEEEFNYKKFFKITGKFALAISLGAVFYFISLPISYKYYNDVPNGYRGFSADGAGKLLSFSGIKDSVISTYENFLNGFFGDIYLIVDELRIAYIIIFALILLFIIMVVINKKIHKQLPRLLMAVLLILLVPFACNFSDFFDTENPYGLMIYSFVLVFVFAILICERSDKIYPVVKSVFAVCMIFVICNFVVGNNIYYLKAHTFNQRTYSFTTRLLKDIDPLIVRSKSKQVAFFGVMPNEYYPQNKTSFTEYGEINDGSALGKFSYLGFDKQDNYSIKTFVKNIKNIHGVNLNSIDKYNEKYRTISMKIILRNIPVWPAKGSIVMIDDVIAINFGVVELSYKNNDQCKYLHARHYISKNHSEHEYEYQWEIFKDDVLVKNHITTQDRWYLDMPEAEGRYRVKLTVKNKTLDYTYPKTAITTGLS